MSARDEILSRARAAIGAAEAAPVRRRYRRRGDAATAVERLRERAAEYGASVHLVEADELERRISARCAALGVARLATPAQPPARPPGVELVVDAPPLPPVELDRLDGALTGCRLAIAETGSLVLDGAGSCGRRALTLVPDLHLCVVAAADVVATVPEAIERLGEAARAGRPLTFISGPSATSDIELERVEGVHGPRRLELFVAAPPPPDRASTEVRR